MSTQYDILLIQQYLEGQLSPQQMHDLERAAMDDPMLNDALEGYSIVNGINHKKLSLLQQRLSDRIVDKHTEKNTFYFTGQRLAIASIAGVMLIVLCTLIWMMNSRPAGNGHGADSSAAILLSKPEIAVLSGSLEPKDSWSAFGDYLSVNGSRLPSGLKVHLAISTVDGRPETVKVLSDHNGEITAELVRLIMNGPAWKEGSGEIIITF
jgi:hypothetical protein